MHCHLKAYISTLHALNQFKMPKIAYRLEIPHHDMELKNVGSMELKAPKTDFCKGLVRKVMLILIFAVQSYLLKVFFSILKFSRDLFSMIYSFRSFY